LGKKGVSGWSRGGDLIKIKGGLGNRWMEEHIQWVARIIASRKKEKEENPGEGEKSF